MSAFRPLGAAAAFLTRVPIPGQPFSPAELKAAPGYFPLVGALIGCGLALVHAMSQPLGPSSAAALTLGASLLLTGCFHEDGLADTADALGGGFTKERVLEILKDSRVGTFGAAALCLSLVARWALLREVSEDGVALIVIESVSRAPPVVVMSLVPYVTRPEHAKSRDVMGGGSAAVVSSCTAMLVLLVAIALGYLTLKFAAVLVLLSFALAWSFSRVVLRRVGGMTGDFLGAIQQVVSLSFWIAWAATS